MNFLRRLLLRLTSWFLSVTSPQLLPVPLRVLDNDEAKVLFYRCKYYDPRSRTIGWVANKAGFSESQFYKLQRSAYFKMGLSKELSEQEKWREVEEKYCGVLLEVGSEEMFEQRRWPPPLEPRRRVNMRRVSIVTALIFLALIIVVRSFRGGIRSSVGNRQPQIAQNATERVLSETPETSQMVLPTTPVAPALARQTELATIQVPTITLSPTDTSIPSTATDTITPSPTSTLIPTETQVPTPTPLFEDNFDNGLSNGWTTIAGKVSEFQGYIMADPYEQPTWIQVGDPDWTDYQVEVNVDNMGCDGATIIALRFQDIGNFVGLKWGCNALWSITRDGVTTGSTQGEFFFGVGDLTMRASAVDDWFQIEGREAVKYDEFPKGSVAIQLVSYVKYDSVRIIQKSH